MSAGLPTRTKRRHTYQLVFNVAGWLFCAAMSFWLTVRGSVLFGFALGFSLYRLVSEIGVLRVQRLSVGQDRRETVAAWLYFSRTAVTGFTVLCGSIVAMVLHPVRAAFVFGGIGVLVGQALLILGVQLLSKLHHRSVD